MQGEAHISGTSDSSSIIWRRDGDPRRERIIAAVLCIVVVLCGLEAFRIGVFVLTGLPVGGIFGFVPVRSLFFGDSLVLIVFALVVLPLFISFLVRLFVRGWPESLALEGDMLFVSLDGSRKPVLRIPVAECGDIDVVQRGLLGGRGWQVRARIFEGAFFKYPFLVLARCETETDAEKLAQRVRDMYQSRGVSN